MSNGYNSWLYFNVSVFLSTWTVSLKRLISYFPPHEYFTNSKYTHTVLHNWLWKQNFKFLSNHLQIKTFFHHFNKSPKFLLCLCNNNEKKRLPCYTWSIYKWWLKWNVTSSVKTFLYTMWNCFSHLLTHMILDLSISRVFLECFICRCE